MSDLGPRYGSLTAQVGYWLKSSRFKSNPQHVITITHCGKLGDFIACLPIASWLYKTRGQEIHFVLAEKFKLFEQTRSLLMLQEMTHDVTLTDFPIVGWEKGGEPYKHDPNKYGISAAEYYNLGFRRTPRRFVSEYVAEEHGLGFDKDFRLTLGDIEHTDEVLISDAFMSIEVPHAQSIDLSQDVLSNARRMAAARESHVCQSGLFHVLDLAGVTPTCVYIYPHSANIHLFSSRLAEHNIKYIDRIVRPRT